jgi:hypothetical protein
MTRLDVCGLQWGEEPQSGILYVAKQAGVISLYLLRQDIIITVILCIFLQLPIKVWP